MKTVLDMGAYFPPGLTYPFYITIDEKDPNHPNGTFTSEYFDDVIHLISLINNATQGQVTPNSVISAPLAYGKTVPFDIADMFIDNNSFLYNTSEGEMYRSLLSTVLTEDKRASLIIMLVTFDPNGPLMEPFFKKTRDIINQFHKTSLYHWNITSLLASNIDVCYSAFDSFSMMIGITLTVVVVFILISMRSLILPIRLVITIGLTVLWTYGLATLIFKNGVIDWIDPNFTHHSGGLYWVVPLIALSIIVGLGIDYDIFLFTRITEVRHEGKSADEAIRIGYYHTGSVITGAGIVMSIAFCGLIFSKQLVLRQLGFFLSTSVLLDTFIIRMMVVPTLLHFLGDLNWWPIKLPVVTFSNQNLPNIINYEPLLTTNTVSTGY